MARLLDDVVHGVPAAKTVAAGSVERAFALRVQRHVEKALAEPPDEGTTSYLAWTLGA